jgi:hypothetical protein
MTSIIFKTENVSKLMISKAVHFANPLIINPLGGNWSAKTVTKKISKG